MLTTVHLLTGAAIGKVTGNIYLAAPLAVVSHYALDFIPHYNPKPVKGYLEKGYTGADKLDLVLKALEPAIGLAAGIFLVVANPPELRLPIFIGGLFGWLPDLLVFLDWKFNIGKDNFIRKVEKKFHRHTSFAKGILIQVCMISIALIILWK